ncbi:MAG TPA: class I SAM-dependent methyltransferase [Terriglobales bacterium]|nr:class I SAM-dependent methyltransferase [Terriglobales bacterium]
MSLPSTGPTISRTIRDWWAQGIARDGLGTTFRNFIAEFWGFLHDSTPEQRRRRYGDVEYDWGHSVDTTSATVCWRDRLLGVFHSPYQPTEPALFHEMLACLHIRYEEFTFIDLGSGKGRTLLMASEYPFRKIVGVELLPELDRVAKKNIENYNSEAQKCQQIEALCGDAARFQFPSEPIVLYLFNPLPPAGLAQVAANLERSLKESPRPVFVIYHNPLHDDVLVRSLHLRKTCGTHQFSVYESR